MTLHRTWLRREKRKRARARRLAWLNRVPGSGLSTKQLSETMQAVWGQTIVDLVNHDNPLFHFMRRP